MNKKIKIEKQLVCKKLGNMISIYNAEHPSRQKAIRILELLIDDKILKDIKEMEWYKYEDLLTLIIEGEE